MGLIRIGENATNISGGQKQRLFSKSSYSGTRAINIGRVTNAINEDINKNSRKI